MHTTLYLRKINALYGLDVVTLGCYFKTAQKPKNSLTNISNKDSNLNKGKFH